MTTTRSATAGTAPALAPAILRASAEDRLAVAPFRGLFRAEGIPLPATDRPVLVLHQEPDRTPRYRGRRQRAAAAGGGHGIALFEGGEHTLIGDSITLKFSAGDPGTPAGEVPLLLANGLELTYGQVLALGGDFYGIPDAPISDGSDHQARFRAAYATLAEAREAVTEAPEILAVMQIEIDAVDQALLAGESPVIAYDKLGNQLNEAWNRITGGGSSVSPWIPEGRYLKLADTNWDHFGFHAVVAYTAGHAVALDKALEAGRQSGSEAQQAMLETAYSMDAFADHFLSDLFSSGHLRTPRKQLYELLTPSPITGLLAKYMHDEDSMNGLYVSNARGDRWKAFGDKRLVEPADAANAALVIDAVQASADEIFDAFLSGQAPPADGYRALDILPDLLQVQDYRDFLRNYSPLFIPKKSTVYERNGLDDLNDHSWTYWWVPASSLARLELIDHHTDEPVGYLPPPTAAPQIQGWSTTRSVPPNWVDGRQVRYAVSFFNQIQGAANDSPLGPWESYVTLDGGFKPVLSVPVDPTGVATGRRIYRQFYGDYPTFVGEIDDNYTTTFTDSSD